MANQPSNNDRGAKWWDGDTTSGDVARATTDEGTSKAEVQHTRNYVWNSGTLVWDRMTQPGGSSGGGGAVTVADGADVAQGTTTDLSSANTVIGLLKNIKAALAATLTVTFGSILSGGSAVTVASQTVDMAGIRNAAGNASVMTGLSDNADAIAVNAGGNLLRTVAEVYGYNGTSWDRLRSSTANGLVVDVSRVAGNVAGTVADGANVALGTTTDLSSGSTVIGLLKNLKAALAGTLTVSGTVTSNVGTGPWPVTDNSGSLTVDAPVGTPAFVRLSDGAAAITTLPVSVAAVVHVDDNAGSLTVDAPVGTPAFVRLSDGVAAISALPVTDNSGSLTVDAPVATPVFVRLSDGAATLIGQKAMASSVPVVVASDQSAIPVTQATITKATQGAQGVTTQDLKDAGRSSRTISLQDFVSTAAAETIMTASYSSDNGVATTGTSYTVTAGKRFRLQAIFASVRVPAGSSVATNCTVRIRINNGGAALVSSPVEFLAQLSAGATPHVGSNSVSVPIPDGYEVVAGAGIAITLAVQNWTVTTGAPAVTVFLIGYEY